MRTTWVRRDIDAPAGLLWELLIDPDRWPCWGPSVRAADVSRPLQLGTTGHVETFFGIELGFEIVAYDEGVRWAWKVAGVRATDHTVVPLGPDRCRVGFGVGWPAAPYLAVCRIALGRLDALALG